jgi:hypothetical protein
MSLGIEDHAPPSGNRWRWFGLALLPGLIAIAALGGFAVLSRMDVDSDAVITIRTVLLFGGGALPLAMPFWVIDLARDYVREMHGGLQSPWPFALMTGAANFVLWLAGVVWAMYGFGPR